ncbi:MAG: hypothetical protein WAM71_21005 [Candidatus Korobacteraceae bacterium]
MSDNTQSGMQCVEWEALLADALDGMLHGSTLAGFEAHQESCPVCGPQYREAAAGMHWLKGLEEVEVPRNLVHNIMVQTAGAQPVPREKAAVAGENWWGRLKGRLAPVFAPVVTPRFAMSFGMAFFSITMLLNVAGFHITDLKHVDLSAKGIQKTYYATEARVTRYYENLRLVYEIESRVRDLRRAARPEDQQQEQQPPKNPNKSQNQQKKEYKHYGSQGQEPVLAQAPATVELQMNRARQNRNVL